MRIAVVVYGELDRRSGGFLYDRMLVDGLRARGHDVEVISQSDGGYLARLLRGMLPDRRILRRLDSVDILVEDELNHPSLPGTHRLVRRRRARGRGTPQLVGIVHHLLSSELSPGPFRRIVRSVERRFLTNLDGVICNSNTTKQAIQDLAAVAAPTVVAPPASTQLPCDAQRREGDESPAYRGFLFVGNLIPRKGLLQLLVALKDLAEERKRTGAAPLPAKLTIVGNPDVNRRYAKKVRRLLGELSGLLSITLLHRVDDEALCTLYRSHDVLAVPSFYEGYGMVYDEAQRFGLAVVGGVGGAGPEVIHDGVTGILVDPKRIDSIKGALRRLIEEPTLARKMGDQGMLRPASTWESTVAAVDTFFKDTLCTTP